MEEEMLPQLEAPLLVDRPNQEVDQRLKFQEYLKRVLYIYVGQYLLMLFPSMFMAFNAPPTDVVGIGSIDPKTSTITGVIIFFLIISISLCLSSNNDQYRHKSKPLINIIVLTAASTGLWVNLTLLLDNRNGRELFFGTILMSTFMKGGFLVYAHVYTGEFEPGCALLTSWLFLAASILMIFEKTMEAETQLYMTVMCGLVWILSFIITHSINNLRTSRLCSPFHLLKDCPEWNFYIAGTFWIHNAVI